MGMKIFLAQQNYHIGNFESNTKKITIKVDAALIAREIDLIEAKRVLVTI